MAANEDATSAITLPPGPDGMAGFGEPGVGWLPCVCPTPEEAATPPLVNADPLPNALVCPNAPVAICCRVGGFGTGGGTGVTGGPNGFLEPVW